mgnify:FL=1
MRNKNLYTRLKPEYLDIILENKKGLHFSLKTVKTRLKEEDFFINLTVSDLDRLSSLLDTPITNINISKLFKNV